MRHYLQLILLSTSILFIFNTHATFGERVCTIVREKTNAFCTIIQEHKKLVAGGVAYLVFEDVGYTQKWKTPLYRLFILPGEFDTVRKQIANLINTQQQTKTNHTYEEEIDALQQQLEKVQQDLQQERERYQKLQRNYKIVKEQLATNLDERLTVLIDDELEKSLQRDRAIKALAKEAHDTREFMQSYIETMEKIVGEK